MGKATVLVALAIYSLLICRFNGLQDSTIA